MKYFPSKYLFKQPRFGLSDILCRIASLEIFTSADLC